MRRDRGQALFETALAMPLFLFVLYGLFWGVRNGALSERVQSGVRYAGEITTLSDPYRSFSQFAVYSVIDGVRQVDPTACSTPVPTFLSSGHAGYWAPSSATAACIGGLSIFPLQSQAAMFTNSYISLSARNPVGGYFSGGNTFGAPTTGVSAYANFVRTPDIGSEVACTALGAGIKASLEGEFDTVTPIAGATQMPLYPQPTPLIQPGGTCTTFSPEPSLPPATAVPVPPTVPPSTTPTPSTTATPTITPTRTPVTPTPIPTATATAKPTATPTPGGTPTPVPTPPPGSES